jgi:hypothetical protein
MAVCLLGCTLHSIAGATEQVSIKGGSDLVARTASLIERYYVDESAREELLAVPKSNVCEQLVLALRNGNPKIVHNAATLLRDQYGSPDTCAPVSELLTKLLADPKPETLFTRMVCCEILGKFPRRDSIAVLIKALDDPGEHSEMVLTEMGGEEVYQAVWEKALRALESIAGEDISSYSGHARPHSPKAKWIDEAKAWWEKEKQRPTPGGTVRR